MNELLKVVLSLSVSGSLPLLLLLLGRPLYRDRLSKGWQYYIWLVVVARLLLPLSPEVSPVGALFREGSPSAPPAQTLSPIEEVSGTAAGVQTPVRREGNAPAAASHAGVDLFPLLWLGGALVLLTRKVTAYQSFARCIQAGREEVSDTALLDRLAQLGEQAGIERPVELYVNSLAASPMLLGFFRPCIVLPTADLPEADFTYTVLHELTHLRRRDMLYKWLVQLTLCLHWFNPLVWRMAGEISRTCELSCDEAVLRTLTPEERRAYGDTLVRALAAGGGCHNSLASTLSGGAEQLKERLRAIMTYQKKSWLTVGLSLLLAAGLTTGAAAAGAYRGPVKAEGDFILSAPAERKAALERQLVEAYAAHGVDQRGPHYSYRGQPVNILLDLRPDGSVNTLSTDPEGMVNIRILRDGEGAVTGVEYLSDEEAAALLEDMEDEDGEDIQDEEEADCPDSGPDDPAMPLELAHVAGGEVVWLGDFYLDYGDRIRYDVLAQAGSDMQVGFAPPGDSALDTTYFSVHNWRGETEGLRCTASFLFTSEFPVRPGEYRLFLRSTGEALTHITGSISVTASGTGVVKLSPEDLPEAVFNALGRCDPNRWYALQYDGRQYIRCGGFTRSFGWQPVRTQSGWQISIETFRKEEPGGLLLSVPEGELDLRVDGEPVGYTVMRCS